jgi:hypothetical protein
VKREIGKNPMRRPRSLYATIVNDQSRLAPNLKIPERRPKTKTRSREIDGEPIVRQGGIVAGCLAARPAT